MAKERGVNAGTGAISGLGSAQDAGASATKEKKTRETLGLPLSRETSEGVKQLATGFGKSRTEVLGDLGSRIESIMQNYLRDLYEKYDAERRKSLGGLFGKPEPATSLPDSESAPGVNSL